MASDLLTNRRVKRYIVLVLLIAVVGYFLIRFTSRKRNKVALSRWKPRMVEVLDPYKLSEDTSIKCLPLACAANGELICTYDSEKDDYISKVLNDHHVWEGDIVEVFKILMKEDPYKGLIDIGLNLGVYTLTAASMGHRVVGVEPYPPNLHRMAKSLRVNTHLIPLVKVVPNAVSNKYETMHFWSRQKHPGATQLHSEEFGRTHNGTTHHEVPDLSVETILADDLLSVIDFKSAIMKIDIEGGEFRALQGASKLFDEVDISHVFMEWDNKGQDKHDEMAEFFIKFFRDRGYTVHTSDKNMTQLELTREACRTWPFDVVFVKRNMHGQAFPNVLDNVHAHDQATTIK